MIRAAAWWLVASVGVAAAEAQPVTFAKDIAPIMFDACASCHRPGGPGPFSLTNYQEVRQRATQIAQVTRSRFMPPWKVEPGVGHFVGQRVLTSDELDRIDRWARDGAPEGDPSLLPPLPKWPEGWLLGRPDLIVATPTFTLASQTSDAFRIFAIRLPVTERAYVRGIEFHPGNARVVHHANIRVDRSGQTRALDEADPLPGYDGLMPRTAEYPDGHFLGWTPGQIAPLVSSDLAWTLEPGSDLVVQLHLQPTGATEEVRSEIGIFFGDHPPTKTPTILRLGSQGIEIAPGDAHYSIHDSYTLPVDVDVLAIQPHAHYRAREMRGTATLPDGTTRLLMDIKDWDFRWQHVYREVEPIRLPKGTRLAMDYTYDNSAENIRNPQVPPARVFWGQRSRDEMGDLWFQLLAHNSQDRALLNGQIERKMTAEDVIGYETLLRVDPKDVELHNDVALLYLSLAQPSAAVRHFQATVDLDPASASTHFNLGTALTAAGRLNEAAAELRAALGRRPDYAAAHNNLGRVLLVQGQTADALEHLEQSVRLDPKNLSAFFNLSEAYVATGAYDRAIDALDRALSLSPPEPLASQLRERRQQLIKGSKVP
jgi:regulator of sirC expression with transglutaminase-like and TPR domain